MKPSVPPNVSSKTLERFILSLADDELVLGHRDSEWTGYSPILEEDIAFSNIAQDEIGHSLVWYTLHQDISGLDPDAMVFKRIYEDFRCCRFVEYPKGDFAYTVVRQFLFDVAEEVRLRSLSSSSYEPLARAAERILKEETYHRLHSQSLLARLGDATPESSRRMQAAVDVAFPQALGIFEPLEGENELTAGGVFSGNADLLGQWLHSIKPAVYGVSLKLPVKTENGKDVPLCQPEFGGRSGSHTPYLKSLVDDLQKVFRMAPEAKW